MAEAAETAGTTGTAAAAKMAAAPVTAAAIAAALAAKTAAAKTAEAVGTAKTAETAAMAKTAETAVTAKTAETAGTTKTAETAVTAKTAEAAVTAGTAVTAKTAETSVTAGTAAAAKTAAAGTAAAVEAMKARLAAAAGTAVPAKTDVSAGTFTDKRDGQTYRTVKTPDGRVWMAQNLNYKPEPGNSWCYNDDESMGGKYGRLYSWRTAMTVAPAGWHLPTHHEWLDLITAKGSWEASVKLKSKSGWVASRGDNKDGNGTDDYGFSALPGGYWDSKGGFGHVGEYGYWWSATEEDSYFATSLIVRNVNTEGLMSESLILSERKYKWDGFSVRCVADV